MCSVVEKFGALRYARPAMATDSQQGGARRAPLSGSEALQALQRGQITVEAYLESRLDRALARLGNSVSDERREMLREVLREQLSSDPVIQEYVRRSVGRADEPSVG